MPVIARVIANRPKNVGRVVEVHRDRSYRPRVGIYELTVVLFNPTIGVHVHRFEQIKGRKRAYAIAERIGQGKVVEVK